MIGVCRTTGRELVRSPSRRERDTAKLGGIRLLPLFRMGAAGLSLCASCQGCCFPG